VQSRLPDLLAIHGEHRMARLLRATLQCDPRLLVSFLEFLFRAEPKVAIQAKKHVVPDRIRATGEGANDDLEIRFAENISRTLYPGIRFSNLNIELKDEHKAHQEKGQLLRYLEQAAGDAALVGYIRLDQDHHFANQHVNDINAAEHPRYVRPADKAWNYTWHGMMLLRSLSPDWKTGLSPPRVSVS